MADTDGTHVVRHDPVQRSGRERAEANDAAIAAHLEAHLGGEQLLWSDETGESPRVHVRFALPTAERPFIVATTSGMSAHPMVMPPNMAEASLWCRAELSILLPGDFRLDEASMQDPRNFWPLGLLKGLARLPHRYGTFLGYGHSVPNGDPPEPYCEGTTLAAAMIIPPVLLGDAFFTLARRDADPVRFYQVLPITAAETAFLLKFDAQRLLGRFDHSQRAVYGPVDPVRTSTV